MFGIKLNSPVNYLKYVPKNYHNSKDQIQVYELYELRQKHYMGYSNSCFPFNPIDMPKITNSCYKQLINNSPYYKYKNIYKQFLSLLLEELMTDQHKGNSQARAKEHNEDSCETSPVLDLEGQILRKEKDDVNTTCIYTDLSWVWNTEHLL